MTKKNKKFFEPTKRQNRMENRPISEEIWLFPRNLT
jgi:hypothetical protein